MGLAKKQVEAMGELLRRAKREGYVLHVGLHICQAQTQEDLDAALQILGELEAEDPSCAWYQFNEWRVEN